MRHNLEVKARCANLQALIQRVWPGVTFAVLRVRPALEVMEVMEVIVAVDTIIYQRTRLSAPAFRHGDDSQMARLDARATTVPLGAGLSPVRQNT